MSNELPDNWEPGHNIKWQPGSDRRVREMARGLLAVLALSGVLILMGVLSGCATCVNRGDAFSKSKCQSHTNLCQIDMKEVTP